MADIIDNTGEEYEKINDLIREQNEFLEKQVSIFRNLTNLAQEHAKQLGNDFSTRRSIMSVSLQLERIFRHHVNYVDEQVKGLRNINHILKDRNIIEDAIRTIQNESNIAISQANFTSIKRSEILREILDEEAKGLNGSKRKIELLKEESITLAKTAISYKRIGNNFREMMGTQNQLLQNLEKEEELVRKINKSLGIAPSLLDGIDKTLRRNGFGRFAEQLDMSGAINRVKLKLADLNAQGKAFPNALKTSGMLTKELTKSLFGAFTKANLIAGAIVLIVDGILKADKAQAELQRKFNLSRDDARSTRREFAHIANYSNNIFVSAKGIQEAFSDINESLGTSGMASSELLENYTLLTKQAGITKETALLLTKIGLTQRKGQKELLVNINKEIGAFKGRTGILLNERKIVEDINKISAGAAAVMGNQVEKLAKAVSSAAALGTSIEKVEQASRNLLEFESSIANELEAQLMTGKDINLNRARELSLIGDLAGVANELKNEVGSLHEFQLMNVFQQESLAKAVGMTRDEVAKLLLDQEAMQRLNVRQGESLQERWQYLVREHGLEKAKYMLGNDALAKQMQSVSNSEKWAIMGEKLLEIFVQLGDVLMPIFNLLTDITAIIVAPIVKGIGVIYDIFRGIGEEIDLALGGTVDWSKAIETIGDVLEVAIVLPMQFLAKIIDGIIRSIKSMYHLGSGLLKFFSFDVAGGVKDIKQAAADWTTSSRVDIKDKDMVDRKIINKWIDSSDKNADFGGFRSDRESIQPFSSEGMVTSNKVNVQGKEQSVDELKELNKNIKVLIGLVKEGKDINMDGYKVGVAMALEAVRVQ